MTFDDKIWFNLLLSLSFGVICAILAYQKKRSPIVWFFIGFFLVYIGFIILIFLSDGHAKSKIEESESNEEEEVEGPPPAPPSAPHFPTGLWFYLDSEGKQHGPVDGFTLQTLWNSRALVEESYVWCEGMDNWKRIREDTDLLGILQEPS